MCLGACVCALADPKSNAGDQRRHSSIVVSWQSPALVAGAVHLGRATAAIRAASALKPTARCGGGGSKPDDGR
eukprot:9431187-Alexandrium_andersonii.AAC.1